MDDELPWRTETFDLRAATDDEISAVVFDHPVVPGKTTAWWWAFDDAKVVIEPRRALAYMTNLFNAPEGLMDRYSAAQIDQGFWFMYSAAAEDVFGRQLWNDAEPWDDRERCIRALPRLYQALFEPMLFLLEDYYASAMFMLPDFIVWMSRPRVTHDGADALRVCQALLDAFGEMLGSSHDATRTAALHGLGHLAHPDRADVIRDFVRANPGLDPELRDYAERAVVGDVL
ncbi:MAG TPA: hypothetical protein VFT45_05095 [Longimicrobium sp.]|nr:hypothetical protein [Longimicrobium sp.]